MPEKKTAKCAHPGCNCPAATGSKYCGAYCEGSVTARLSRAIAGMGSVLPAKRRVQRDSPRSSPTHGDGPRVEGCH